MESRKNKPRVFLSHSKVDIDFIRRIYEDLRKCQVDPWIDEEDIRHGKPWLDSIFEDGIPTCDSVIVYFTEEALQSQMVKKEIDASIISQLSDKKVAFLPYVINASVRKRLRPDIQALQVQEWNTNNYTDVFPKVVAEVWRSFMERSVQIATQEEQNKRLRLELELQKTKQEGSGTVFSSSEQADFEYIWQSLDRPIEFFANVNEENNAEVGVRKQLVVENLKYALHLGSLVGQLITLNRTEYQSELILNNLKTQCASELFTEQEIERNRPFEVKGFEDPRDELLTYGLIQGVYVPPPPNSDGKRSFLMQGPRYRYSFTDKMYRFRYWLAFSKKLPEGIVIKRTT